MTRTTERELWALRTEQAARSAALIRKMKMDRYITHLVSGLGECQTRICALVTDANAAFGRETLRRTTADAASIALALWCLFSLPMSFDALGKPALASDAGLSAFVSVSLERFAYLNGRLASMLSRGDEPRGLDELRRIFQEPVQELLSHAMWIAEALGISFDTLVRDRWAELDKQGD